MNVYLFFFFYQFILFIVGCDVKFQVFSEPSFSKRRLSFHPDWNQFPQKLTHFTQGRFPVLKNDNS